MFLTEARQLSTATVDQIAAAIADFEQSTSQREFRLFRPEQAQSYKHRLAKLTNPSTKRGLSKATISSRLAALKAFFQWLSQQPGFKRLNFTDADYFNLSGNDERIAKAVRERPAPTIDQIRHVVLTMPLATVIERRNRALIAFTLISGARDDAIASMSLKHVDFGQRRIDQDAREVRTKNAKTMTTWFFPVGQDMESILEDWIHFLRTEMLWGDDDPLFPASKIAVAESGHFENCGLDRKHWKSAAAIREIFRNAFAAAGLPYFNPHSFRKTLALYGYKVCSGDFEALKAWSQNLGHTQMLTTLSSYGNVPLERQAEILRCRRDEGFSSKPGGNVEPDPGTIQNVLAHLARTVALAPHKPLAMSAGDAFADLPAAPVEGSS
jgi:site-specific recombinase XerC